MAATTAAAAAAGSVRPVSRRRRERSDTVTRFIDKKTGDKIELHLAGLLAGPLSAYLDPDALSECMALIDAVE